MLSSIPLTSLPIHYFYPFCSILKVRYSFTNWSIWSSSWLRNLLAWLQIISPSPTCPIRKQMSTRQFSSSWPWGNILVTLNSTFSQKSSLCRSNLQAQKAQLLNMSMLVSSRTLELTFWLKSWRWVQLIRVFCFDSGFQARALNARTIWLICWGEEAVLDQQSTSSMPPLPIFSGICYRLIPLLFEKSILLSISLRL